MFSEKDVHVIKLFSRHMRRDVYYFKERKQEKRKD